MHFAEFIDVVAWVAFASCAAGLLLLRPMKTWPRERWIDHPDERIRLLFRACLFVSCILPPLSAVWVAVGAFLRYFGHSVDPGIAAELFQVAVLAIPLPVAYLLYRYLLAHFLAKRTATNVA